MVSKEESEGFARSNNMLYAETSAKTIEGIEKAFEAITNCILQSIGQAKEPSPIIIRKKDKQSQCEC